MIDSQQVQRFHDDGYLLVRRVYTATQLQAMRERVADYLEGRRPYPEQWLQVEAAVADGVVSVDRPAAGYRKLTMITLVDPLFHDMAADTPLAGILQDCLGSNICAWGSGIFLKQPQTGGRQPWHRDIHGYDGPAATIWTPLMDATVENGCIQIALQSHQVKAPDGLAFNAKQEEDHQQGRFEHPVRCLEMQAGDCVIWDMNTLHSSEPNRSDKPRWALAVHCATTEASEQMSARSEHAGPHDIIAGRHDAQTAGRVRCMHCDRQAFGRWGD